MFDSSISPSGLLERLVIGWLYFNDKIAIKIAINQPVRAKRNSVLLKRISLTFVRSIA